MISSKPIRVPEKCETQKHRHTDRQTHTVESRGFAYTKQSSKKFQFATLTLQIHIDTIFICFYYFELPNYENFVTKILKWSYILSFRGKELTFFAPYLQICNPNYPQSTLKVTPEYPKRNPKHPSKVIPKNF